MGFDRRWAIDVQSRIDAWLYILFHTIAHLSSIRQFCCRPRLRINSSRLTDNFNNVTVCEIRVVPNPMLFPSFPSFVCLFRAVAAAYHPLGLAIRYNVCVTGNGFTWMRWKKYQRNETSKWENNFSGRENDFSYLSKRINDRTQLYLHLRFLFAFT